MIVLRISFLFCVVGNMQGAVIPNGLLKSSKSSIKPPGKGIACNQRVSGFRSHAIDINEGCKKGQIQWTLTSRSLDLSYKVSGTKELCFSSRAPPGLEKYSVFKKSGDKMEKIGTPRKAFDVCSTINKGLTTFRITAPTIFYGLYVRYSLVDKEISP